MATVSPTVKSVGIPSFLQFSSINPASKEALWAISTHPSQNFRKSGSTSPITGASRTISSLMPVNCSISNGIGSCGFTNVLNRSVILPFSTFTAPISMMRLFTALSPVVSRSKTT